MLRGECRRRRRKNNGKPTRNIRKPYCVLSELKVDRGFPQGALVVKNPPAYAGDIRDGLET